MATTPTTPELRVPLERIRVPDNVRALDPAHVEALAGSIRLQGLIVPLIVRSSIDPADERFELIAGLHRFAAARALGPADVPVVVRDAEGEDRDGAVENSASGPLDAREEARGKAAMLVCGQFVHAHPHDDEGQPGTVYVLHFEPAYRHARHYIGWAVDVDARLAEHLAGSGSPLVRAAVAADVRVELAATIAGSRHLERRLKRWHKTGQFCPRCRASRGGKAR